MYRRLQLGSALTLVMCLSALTAQAQGTLGFTPPGDDQQAAWDFQKAVGAVFAREHLQFLPETREAAYAQKQYDSSQNFQARTCISAIRDQGNCGSCWDFAATAVLEAVWCQENGILPDLSEQRVLECRGDNPQTKCDGSWEQVAYDVMRGQGVPQESDDAYDPANVGACSNSASWPVQFGVDGTQFLDTQSSSGQPSVDDIKHGIVNTGAVTIVVQVTKTFDKYGSGDPPISNDNTSLATARGLHEIVVTGWDDDKGAWHLKNSWGTALWGDAGWGWIAYNDKSIVGNHFSTATPKYAWPKADQARIMNSIVSQLLISSPNIFSTNPTVNWPTSLGFPPEKMTVNDGMTLAMSAGLLAPGSTSGGKAPAL
jgi:C1A family cysteine protease